MVNFLNILCWNCCLATVFAILLTMAQRFRFLRNRPHVCHGLWLLVLLKLVTPPLLTIPVSLQGETADPAPGFVSGFGGVPGDVADISAFAAGDGGDAVRDSQQPTLLEIASRWCTMENACMLWGSVSVLLLTLSVRASLRMGRLLRETIPAPDWIQHSAVQSAKRMGLRTVPSVQIVNATISPFLWLSLRGPIIVIPGQLVDEVGEEAVGLILRHELAHFVRCDHLTNLFASGLAIVFWWNPVVWWARRQLREFQERCCDSTVLSLDVNQRVRYAETLLAAVDFVASAGAKYPSPQTTFGDSKSLKRRIEMIVSQQPTSGTMRTRLFSLLAATVMLPLGLASAQDFEAVERRLGEAVAAGELSLEQAQVMMDALRDSEHDEAEHEYDREAEFREHLEHRIREIKEAVERGLLSREEAGRLIEETERAAHREHEHHRREYEARRREYMEIERKLDRLVEAGEISVDEAEEKLIAVYEELFGDREEHEHEEEAELAERKEEFEQRVRRIKAAVEQGEMSADEAQRVIEDTREALFGGRDDEAEIGERRMLALKRRYMLFMEKIKSSVEAGELSEEDAEKKLIAIREKMFGDEDEAAEEAEEQEANRREKFRAAERELVEALEAGEITEEQAEDKLREVRKKLFED